MYSIRAGLSPVIKQLNASSNFMPPGNLIEVLGTTVPSTIRRCLDQKVNNLSEQVFGYKIGSSLNQKLFYLIDFGAIETLIKSGAGNNYFSGLEAWTEGSKLPNNHVLLATKVPRLLMSKSKTGPFITKAVWEKYSMIQRQQLFWFLVHLNMAFRIPVNRLLQDSFSQECEISEDVIQSQTAYDHKYLIKLKTAFKGSLTITPSMTQANMIDASPFFNYLGEDLENFDLIYRPVADQADLLGRITYLSKIML